MPCVEDAPKCDPHTGNVIGCRFLSAHPPGLCYARYLSGGLSYTRFTASTHPHPTHFLSGTRYTTRITHRTGIGTPRHFTPSQRTSPPAHTPRGHAVRPATGFPSMVQAVAPSRHADGPCSAHGHIWHIAATACLVLIPWQPQLIRPSLPASRRWSVPATGTGMDARFQPDHRSTRGRSRTRLGTIG